MIGQSALKNNSPMVAGCCTQRLPTDGAAPRKAKSMAQQRLHAIAAARRECGRARLDGLCAASSPPAPAVRLGADYWGGDRQRCGRGRATKLALRSCGSGGMLLGDARAGGRR